MTISVDFEQADYLQWRKRIMAIMKENGWRDLSLTPHDEVFLEALYDEGVPLREVIDELEECMVHD